MDISAIALQGLQQSQSKFERAAVGMASAGIDSPGDIVDLSQEATALLQAKTGYEASLRVMEAAQQIQKQAVDLLA